MKNSLPYTGKRLHDLLKEIGIEVLHDDVVSTSQFAASTEIVARILPENGRGGLFIARKCNNCECHGADPNRRSIRIPSKISPDQTKLSRYVISSPAFKKPDDGGLWRILFASRTAIDIEITEATWHALQEGLFAELPEHVFRLLLTCGILVESSADEGAEIKFENAHEGRFPNQLNAMVCATSACQMRCVYCGQQHTINTMSSKSQKLLLKAVEKQLLDHPHFTSIRIGWFGGEPLL